MSEEHDINAAPENADRELERALRTIAPAAARIDSISAAFNAGSRSNRRKLRAWQGISAATMLLAIAGWSLPIQQHGTSNHQQSSFVRVSQPSPASPSPQSLWRLQQTVEEHGIDALPLTSIPPAKPMRPDQI